MDRDFVPGLEEEEKEEDRIYAHNNKRMSIDVTSEKTKGKAPAILTDPSADHKVHGGEPERKTLKLPANQPRSSPTLSFALGKEPPKKSIFKFKVKYSLPPPVVHPGSSMGYPYIPRGLSHVKPESVTGSWLTGVNAFRDDLIGILDYEPLTGAERAFVEMPQLLGNTESILNSFVKKYQAEHETAKKDNFGIKRKRNLRWPNIEDMLLSLTNLPETQMEAVCALYRQEKKTHERTSSRISDSQYKKLNRIVEFLTAGNVLGPCKKTSEELEETYRGATAYCSWLVYTFSTELHRIYTGGSDMYFN